MSTYTKRRKAARERGMRPRFPILFYVVLTLIVLALISAVIATSVVIVKTERENRELIHHLFYSENGGAATRTGRTH